MKSKSFIIYPKTKIAINNPIIEIVEAPIKEKLKSFITGYIQDYREAPTVEYLQSIFDISEQDAHMALVLFSKQSN